jgi:hypothetical protein
VSFVYRLRRYVHSTPRALVRLATKNGIISAFA